MAELHPTRTRIGLLEDVHYNAVVTEGDVIRLHPVRRLGGFAPCRVTARIRQLEAAGWVRDRGDRWVLTDRGFELVHDGGGTDA